MSNSCASYTAGTLFRKHKPGRAPVIRLVWLNDAFTALEYGADKAEVKGRIELVDFIQIIVGAFPFSPS